MLPGFYLVFFLVVTGNLFAAALLETGQNVINKTRLVKVLDEYPTNWITEWNCEVDFPVETCQRIRNQQIDIELVHIYTEELVCDAGWSASSPTDSGCTLPCQADSYGENCAFKCRCLYGRNCDPVDGSCDCYDGWKGHDCSTRCSAGEYGPNCRNRTHICENRGINHPVSGECLCPDGYRGDRCEIECNPSTDSLCGFDCELCDQTNTDYCDFIVSSCRCKPGWRGLYCTEPCAPGSSGLFCHDFCCSGIGFCDEERDRCLCLGGYSGDTCQDKCEDGFFGRDCKERCSCPSCHHVTGKCDSCPHGYFGDRCTEACPVDRWGRSCNESCVCLAGERCDVFTGQCTRQDEDNDFSTKKWQSPDTTDITPPTTTPADEDTPPPSGLYISLTLLALLAIIVSVLLLGYFCRHRSMERRKTFAAAGPSPRAIDDVKDKKENTSNQRVVNLYESPKSNVTQPAENPYQQSDYSTVDLTTANTSSDKNTYMTLNAETPGYASIGQ